jgi:NADH-quinone oxidoreductase subunit A
MYFRSLLLFNNLKVILLVYSSYKKIDNMQSDQLIIFQFYRTCCGFVVGTIIVSGKLGPKRSSEVKDKKF